MKKAPSQSCQNLASSQRRPGRHRCCALDWIRSRDVGPGDDDDIPEFEKLGSIPVSRRTPEQRAKDLEDALNWMRNKGTDDESNDPTGQFRKIDSMLPKRPGQTPEERAREIEGALDWMRNNGVSPDSVDSIPGFDKIGSVPTSRRTPEQRAKDLEDALNWMRNKGDNDDVPDPTGEFRKLDQMLPKKKGQTPEERAREIESALDWIRNGGISPVADEEVPSLKKIGSVPVSQRSPEDRSHDIDNILTWLRSKKDASIDPTGEFKKIDQLLPKNKGQSKRDRAKDIEMAIDWLRNKGFSPETDDSEVPGFDKLGAVSFSKRSPEVRSGDIGDILTWLRNGKNDSDDPTGDFKKIDQVLPKKKKHPCCGSNRGLLQFRVPFLPVTDSSS